MGTGNALQKTVSCLTITQESHFSSLEFAIADFARQSYQAKELVVVHDGSDFFHNQLVKIKSQYNDCRINIYQEQPGRSLGELRNKSVAYANGELVCQWDDDDRYHSDRLIRQYSLLMEEHSRFCFLTDQLHWFADEGVMFWDDWDVETYPMNLIQGTLLGYKQDLPFYPEINRGEDTPVVVQIAENDLAISQLKDAGYLYIYVYNGRNAWDRVHHKSISSWKRLKRNRLEKRWTTLQAELKDFQLECEAVHFLHDEGKLIMEF